MPPAPSYNRKEGTHPYSKIQVDRIHHHIHGCWGLMKANRSIANSSSMIKSKIMEQIVSISDDSEKTSDSCDEGFGNSTIGAGRRSLSCVDMNATEAASTLLRVKVMAADMPEFMQVHVIRSARRAYDGMNKFSSKQMAHDIKKDFDEVYGATWHCIVGTSFGSFVTHSRGCFIYFSMEKITVMLFKTRIRMKEY